ncbi:MAG: hypothetical protein AAFR68_20525 [Pseudomonadota bacterium]
MRLLVMGASGCGTSTLGRALASALASQHFDADDFFWLPTDPPFTKIRPVAARAALMEAVFVPRADWVLSGSLITWGAAATARMTAIVFVTLDPEVRIARLIARERRRYGARIAPGGDRHEAFTAFLDWARGYDDPSSESSRNRARHEDWLAQHPAPKIRVDAAGPVDVLANQVLEALP